MAKTVEHIRIGRCEDLGIGRTRPHLAPCVEQRVVTLLMKITHLGRPFHVSANPGTSEITPVAVIARANVNDYKIAVTDNPVRSKKPLRSGVGAGANNIRALSPFAT